MPVIQCSCGKQLRVPDGSAGNRVKCPACGQVCLVPAVRGAEPHLATAAAPAAPKPAPKINFRCTCGQVMQARPEHAGLKSKCPACGTVVAIPRPGAPAGAVSERPPQPAVPRAPVREDPDLEPRPYRKAPAAKGSALPWIIGALALLLLVGGGIGAVFFFKGKGGDGGGDGPPKVQAPPPVQDVDLIPGDAQGFAMLRVADLWNAELTQKAVQESLKGAPPGTDPLADVRSQTGLTPNDVERVTVVVLDVQQEMGWGMLTGTKPFDREKLLGTWFKGTKPPEEISHAGKTLQVVVTPDRERMAVCFVHDTLLVGGPEEGVKRCLNQLGGQRSAGPLDDAVKRAGEKHLVLLAGTPPPDLVAKARENLPDFLQAAAPLLDTQGASVTLDTGDLLKLELGLRLPDEEKSKAAKEAAQQLVSVARFFLPQVKTQLAKDFPKEAADAIYKQIVKISNSIKVEQAGQAVTMQVSADTKGLGDNLGPLLPALMGGGGPGSGGPRAVQHQNNLKQLALAMHNYHDVNGKFPPAVIYSKDGKTPLYSWRVELLPYVEAVDLYQQFNKEEPWNSPNNIKLVSKMPAVFRLPGDPPAVSMTPYQVFVGPGTPWTDGGRTGLRMQFFTDGTSNTILIAEASRKVLWTQPDDIRLRPNASPLPLLGSKAFPGVFYAAMADGSVKKVPLTVSDKTLRDAINPADSNPLGPDWPN